MRVQAVKERSAIEERLTPAVSMSRTGKMAHFAMHTDALVRNGVAALQKKIKKGNKKRVTLAEIIDPSQMDSFGTALPGQDGGRGRELCSSPRGHPELQNKLEELRVNERTVMFKEKMDLKTTPQPIQPTQAQSPSLRTLPVEQPPAQSGAKPTVKQSACFQTVDRFMESKYKMKTPPVGHYRPKFTAVDVNARSTKITNRTTSSIVRKTDFIETVPKASKEQVHSAPVIEEDPAAVLRQAKSWVQDSANLSESKQFQPAPPSGPSQPARTAEYNNWVDRRRLGIKQLGTSCFVSNIKTAADRPTQPPISPDKYYYPYNEVALVHKKEVKAVSLNWSKHTSRKDRIMFKGYSDRSYAPDVVYNSDKMGTNRRAVYNFDDQTSRGKAAVDAQHMVSRRHKAISAASPGNVLHRFPASHVIYDTSVHEKLKFKNGSSHLEFSRAVSREQCPTQVQRPRQPLDPAIPYDTTSADRIPPDGNIVFKNQTNRAQYLDKLPFDLEYDVKPTFKRSPAADVDRTTGHEALFMPSITMECSYHPNYDAVKPRTQTEIRLDRMLSRDEVRGGVPKPTTLDAFYNTDPKVNMKVGGIDVQVPIVGKRIQGNPMIHSHISRDKLAAATATRKSSPDRFYDYDINKTKPCSSKGVDFKRIVAREQQSCGRLLPMSPRQIADNPRSPGFIYDPRPVVRHTPALSFSKQS